MTTDPKETSVTIQDVDRKSMKYRKTEREDPSWAAQEGQLLVPASNLELISDMQSTGTSMDIFVRGVGVGLTGRATTRSGFQPRIDIRYAIDGDVDGYFCPGVGVGLTHSEKLIIKKMRIARETRDLEAETGEESKKPDVGRVVSHILTYQTNIQVA